MELNANSITEDKCGKTCLSRAAYMTEPNIRPFLQVNCNNMYIWGFEATYLRSWITQAECEITVTFSREKQFVRHI